MTWPGWTRVSSETDEKTGLRADRGGSVEMQYGQHPLVHAGDTICTITDHFKREERRVAAPFTGLIVGVLQNPVAAPGHPLRHLVSVVDATRREIEREIEAGEFTERPWT